MARLNDEEARLLDRAVKNETRRRNQVVHEAPLLVEAAFGQSPSIPQMAKSDDEQPADRRDGGDRRHTSVGAS